jgi:excisionase family DNA binding protein
LNISNEPLLTPSEAAELLHVAPTTIRHWAQNGRLPFIRTPGGHRRFSLEDVLSLMSSSKESAITSFSILIVEDDKEFADMLVQLLESYFPQINITVAYSGFEAGDLLHSFKPDLVILDLMMSDINGFSICHRIKSTSSTQHIHVVAVTGALTDENIKKITHLGAEMCFGKPLQYDAFKEAITKFIQNKSSEHNDKISQ